MHAKSGLRVVLKWEIYRPDSVIADVIPSGHLMRIAASILVLLLVGCNSELSSSGQQHKAVDSKRTFHAETPSAIFRSSMNAGRQGDWSTFFDAFTQRGQDMQVGILLVSIATNDSSKLKSLGLTKSGVEKITTSEDLQTYDMLTKLASLITNKKEFYVEHIVTPQYHADWLPFFDTAEVSHVTVSENTAIGVVKDGSDEKPIHFRLIDGQWRLDAPRPDPDAGFNEGITIR